MTDFQFALLSRLLSMPAPVSAAARAVLVDGSLPAEAARLQGCALPELEQAIIGARALENEIRGAFVLHGPNDFRVCVGHHDMHRMPGAQPALQVGEIVRLQAHSTERWIPVRIVSVPEYAGGYYEGIIVEQLAKSSAFQPGNRARFSEDQVMILADAYKRPGIPGRLPRRMRARRGAPTGQ